MMAKFEKNDGGWNVAIFRHDCVVENGIDG